MNRLRSAFVWTRGRTRLYYATAVRAGGWALAAWEIVVDRFHNLGVLTAAVGMILYKTVAKSTNGGDQ